MEQLSMFSYSADDARRAYNDEAYIQGMIAVIQAIINAAPNSKSCCVTIELTKTNPAYQIKKSLQERGFDVWIRHEENSSEINIRW